MQDQSATQNTYEIKSKWDPARYQGLDTERAQYSISWIPAGTETILDAGCGNGVISNLLTDRDWVVGVDLSLAALKWVEIPRCQASVSALPFEDRSFDALISTEVIEHLPITSYRNSLAEFARVADRHILISVPYNEDLEYEHVICPECRCHFNINYHMRRFNQCAIENLFRPWNFNLLRVEAIFPIGMPLFYRTWRKMGQRLFYAGMNFSWRAVCPQCSYSIYKEGTITPQKKTRPKLLMWLYKFWPKYPLPRWWIALYERDI